jgi:hypothetical protein
MRIREVVEIDATTEITVETHATGSIDVILRDPTPGGSRVFISCADGPTLSRLVEVAVAFLRRGDPPRQSSATFDQHGVVIPDERDES